MASDFARHHGLSHKLFTAGDEAGFTPASWNMLAESPELFHSFADVIAGRAKIVPIIEATSVILPDDTLIHVDRSIRPVYPDWVKLVMHPELEPTGPVEYGLSAIDPWLHDGQKHGRSMKGNKLYEYLKEKKMLESCLSLRDGEEIQKKGLAVFWKFFQGKAVFLWKSVVQNRDGNLNVPYLCGCDGGVVVDWLWLAHDWHGSNPALRFAS